MSGFDAAVAIVIPALNEEAAIGAVLSEIPPANVRQVIVVDNGSIDKTAEVARSHRALVVPEPVRGYGRAVLAGLRHVDAGVNVIVVLDADHSDYPEDLTLLLQPILDGRADFVIGNRSDLAAPGSLLIQQRFGNKLTCWLIERFFGFRYRDMGPFRAIRQESLERLRMEDQNFGWNVEMQVKAVKAGLRIVEIPVRYRPRIGRSKISGTVRGTVKAGAIILFSILRYGRWKPA